MKVILLKDVARIGKRFEISEVPTGHALNFLIPQKIAEPATAENIKRIEALKNRQEQDAVESDEVFEVALQKITEGPIEMKVRTNKEGHLFKGIKSEDIEKHLLGQGIEIAASFLDLTSPIKEVGEYPIDVISGERTGVLTLKVLGE